MSETRSRLGHDVHTFRVPKEMSGCALVYWLAFAMGALAAPADQLHLKIDLASGDVALVNPGITNVNFVAYSLDSPSGGLRANHWLSIADNFDASGDQSIDADQNWTELIGVDDTLQLAEAVFSDGDGGILSPGQTLLFGSVWDNDGALDLSADVVQLDNEFADISVEYIGSLADFNRDRAVDVIDFAIWSTFRNAAVITSPTQGDADRDGDVDLRDFAIWQQDAGGEFSALSMVQLEALAASVTVGGAVVPEPSTWSQLMLLVTAGMLFMPGLTSVGLGQAIFRKR